MGSSSFLKSVISIGTSIAALALVGTNPFLAAAVVVGGLLINSTVLAESPTEIKSDAIDTGTKFNTRTTKAPLKVLYGQRRIGGNDVYIKTGDTNNDVLYIVTTLSEGECQGLVSVDDVEQMWIGDRLSNDFGGNVDLSFKNGTADQVVDAGLNAFDADYTDRLKLTCHIVQKFTFSPEYFLSYPNPRTFLVQGLKIRDLRDQSIAYSANPALCLYDYLTNTRYGIGIDSSKIDTQSVVDAANYCDFKGWEFHMLIGDEHNAQEIIDLMLFHFRGVLVWKEGQLFIRFAELQTIHANPNVKTIENKHIVQDNDGKALISISAPSTFSTSDTLRVKYIEPDNNYIEDSIMIGESTGVVNEISYPGCTIQQQAADLGVYYLERMNLNRSVVGTFRDDLISLEPNDVVTLTTDALFLTDQVMRVKSMTVGHSGLVNLGLIFESTLLYDDDFNLTAETIITNNLVSPQAEPPSVSAILSERTTTYRLRTFTTLSVAVTPPATYPWWDHSEVWIAITSSGSPVPDDSAFFHEYNITESFDVPNVEEGEVYNLRLVSVNIWGRKETFSTAVNYTKEITGITQIAPTSLSNLVASANDNAVNVFTVKVVGGDVEIYEFRLGVAGGTWSSSIFLSSLRSPNLSLQGVKPGDHLFFANTLANNGEYGDTAVSASASLADPPDNWAIQATDTIAELVVNPDMVDDSDWVAFGTPTTEEQSNEQAHAGTFSWKFVSDGAGDGIKSAIFTTINNTPYGCSLWVYPSTATKVQVTVRAGDDGGNSFDQEFTGLNAGEWNEITFTYTEGVADGGVNAFIAISDGSGDTGTWYVDDVAFLEGTYSNTIPTLSGGSIFVKTNGALSGTWKPTVIDRTVSGREMSYILADISITGTGTTWDDKFPSPTTWDEGSASTLSWNQIFELTEAPQVEMSLFYSASTDPPNNEITKMEILSTIQTARYYQVKYTITDPNINVKALVGLPTTKFLTS